MIKIMMTTEELKELMTTHAEALKRASQTANGDAPHQRIKELEQEIERLRGELDFTREHGAKLMSELEETELECGEWRREVFELGEALGLGNKWTTADALAAIEAPKSIIAAVRAAVEWGNSEPVDKPSQRAAIIARLRRALGDET